LLQISAELLGAAASPVELRRPPQLDRRRGCPQELSRNLQQR